jgi:phage tail sheath protein FI
MSGNTTVSLANGADAAPTDANLETAYGLFNNKDLINVNLILTGAADPTLQNYIITSLAMPGSVGGTGRGDCVAFVSPPQAAVVNNTGSEVSAIQTWLTSLNAYSSYAVADSGWKYMFDKYNNVYRWVPLNGDIAGLCVFTDSVRDPWFSPAGFNRGTIKNCIKLAWNPNQAQRDTLYPQGVNPVVTFPGQGTILYGDKTLQNKPSAFDRINVRRLFIVLETAISQAAQASLFELNDDFTRAQFVSMVTPFLRDVQGRRGITDFKVVCDTTNNTAQVIDTNQFVGDIYIKPARSINYIQLNFVAVATGVDFSTVVGAA